MKKLLFFFALLFSASLFSQSSYSPKFHLLVYKKDSVKLIRIGNFLPTLTELSKKTIDPLDPGSCGHLTVLEKDVLHITATNDTLEKKLSTPGSFVYIFQNTDLIDSTRFLTLIADSTTAEHFLEKINHITRRQW